MEKIVENRLKISRNIVYVFHERVGRDEALKLLAVRLYESGYVRESFGTAVLRREKTFPTGLPTEPVGVAIPHTDSEHVNVSALAVGVLTYPVPFQEMGSLESEVDVRIISMMAISDPKSVMPVLRALALAYQDREFLSSLKDCQDEEMILSVFQARIPEVIELA